MNLFSKKYIMVAILAVLIVAMAVATLAASKPALPNKNGCPMAKGVCCPLSTSKGNTCALACACVRLNATVVAVNPKSGTLTLKVKPAPGSSSALKSAISKLKVGETTSVMGMVGKDGKLTSCSMCPLKTNAKYSCPMHPCACSSKPGKCPKCGADLKPATPKALASSVSKLR